MERGRWSLISRVRAVKRDRNAERERGRGGRISRERAGGRGARRGVAGFERCIYMGMETGSGQRQRFI